jgi:penicillin-binding protein-related factor A (putative recombinase)
VKEKFKKTACFELKHCKGKSLPFSDVKDHQVAALVAASDKGLVFKIPDLGVQNPFDCFSLFRVPAYVVIKYPDSFELIPIENFLHEKERSKLRKSLTYERAKAISTISIQL